MAPLAKPEVLFVGSMPEWYEARLADDFTLLKLAAAPDKDAFLRDVGPRTVAMIPAGQVDKAMLDRLPKLRCMASPGAGYNHIDIEEAWRRGVVVANTPDITDGCVADMALALLLAAARQIVQGDRFVRSGRWAKESYPLVPRVWGRRMGILGLGRIGKAIAKRAEAFDMTVAYHNRRPRNDVAYTFYASLAELARNSDYLVVACPGGKETHHIVDAEVLRALGKDGIVVNIARGTIIDEPALLKALQGRTIAAAGIDVFEFEPKVPVEFFALDNIVMMPHRGGGTWETWRDSCDLVKENLKAFFRDGKVLTPIERG
jgi:lactate dehydrogenase-like 2-hydroxyacid dehydrogenase